MLKIPCSLFLENKDKKMVVSLLPTYGFSTICIRQYKLWKDSGIHVPPYQDYYTDKEGIFTNPHVIIPKYKLLEFITEENPVLEVQSDFPLAAVQEKHYFDYLSFFYNSKTINNKREEWLWNAFYTYVIGKDIKKAIRFFNQMQSKHFIRSNYNKIWKQWEYWKSALLINSDPCTELIFKNYF